MGAMGEVIEVIQVTLGLEVTPRVAPGAPAVVEVEMAGAGTLAAEVGRAEKGEALKVARIEPKYILETLFHALASFALAFLVKHGSTSIFRISVDTRLHQVYMSKIRQRTFGSLSSLEQICRRSLPIRAAHGCCETSAKPDI